MKRRVAFGQQQPQRRRTTTQIANTFNKQTNRTSTQTDLAVYKTLPFASTTAIGRKLLIVNNSQAVRTVMFYTHTSLCKQTNTTNKQTQSKKNTLLRWFPHAMWFDVHICSRLCTMTMFSSLADRAVVVSTYKTQHNRQMNKQHHKQTNENETNHETQTVVNHVSLPSPKILLFHRQRENASTNRSKNIEVPGWCLLFVCSFAFGLVCCLFAKHKTQTRANTCIFGS